MMITVYVRKASILRVCVVKRTSFVLGENWVGLVSKIKKKYVKHYQLLILLILKVR